MITKGKMQHMLAVFATKNLEINLIGDRERPTMTIGSQSPGFMNTHRQT